MSSTRITAKATVIAAVIYVIGFLAEVFPCNNLPVKNIIMETCVAAKKPSCSMKFPAAPAMSPKAENNMARLIGTGSSRNENSARDSTGKLILYCTSAGERYIATIIAYAIIAIDAVIALLLCDILLPNIFKTLLVRV